MTGPGNYKLSTGSIEKIAAGAEVPQQLILQIIGSRKIGGQNGNNRYRLMVSDGVKYHPFAMLATEMNQLYESNQLTDFSIIKIHRHVGSVVNRNDANERRVIILFELECLHTGDEVGGKIGNPEQIDMTKGAASTAASESGLQKENLNQNSRAEALRNQYVKREDTSMNSSVNFGDHTLTVPIETLSPYQNRWTIKARVMSKPPIRSWSNAKGEGRLFSVDLSDETGEIRMTGFRESVDKYYDMLEVDKVFYISKCQLKAANKQYSQLKNEYEMTITNETVIQECTEPTQIPAMKYEFVPIADIAMKESGAFVDVIAVVKEVGDLVNLRSKAGRDLQKRELNLIDKSMVSIQLTLWGDEAASFNGYDQPVLLIKNARITEFGGGKSLGTASGTNIKLNPDIDDGHILRGWFDNEGASGDVKSLSARTQGTQYTEWVNFHESKLRNLGAGDKPDYYQVKGFIHNVRNSNAFYKACPAPECNKKVVDQENGMFHCDKCNNDTPNFKYRLLLNMLIGDWTSNRWVTAFSDQAEVLLGKTSQEIGSMLENDKEAADALFSDITFQQKTFKLRTKVETYQDVPKNKVTLTAVTETNYKDYNKHLLANIQRMTGIKIGQDN